MAVIADRTQRQTVRILTLALFALLGASQVLAQDDGYAFSQAVGEQTIVFEAVNPETKDPGVVTITISSGTFHVKKISEGQFAGGSRITGNQKGSFSFVPYDQSQPTINATIKYDLAGDTMGDSISFYFLVEGKGSDGSAQSFLQREILRVNEYGAEIKFGKLRRVVEK